MTHVFNACLRAIAEPTVVAVGSAEAFHARVIVFVAQRQCRVSAGIAAWLAIGDRVARLAAVAEQIVGAVGVNGRINAFVIHLVAGVVRTNCTVVTQRRRARLTYSVHAILDSVAESPVVAVVPAQAFDACVVVLVAQRPAWIGAGVLTWLATTFSIAGFVSIAEESIIAQRPHHLHQVNPDMSRGHTNLESIDQYAVRQRCEGREVDRPTVTCG